MKTLFTKFFLLIIILLLSLCIKNYAQMPPHPSMLERIDRGEIAKPYTLSNLNLIRSKGVDEPWSAPELQMLKKQNTFSRSYGPSKVPSGSWKALAILIEFTDNTSQVNGDHFDSLLFGTSTGTLHDYYKKVSYGALDIVTVNLPSTIGWVTAPQPYSYYVNGENGLGGYPQNSQKLVEDIVDIVDPQIDFSKYDNDGDGFVDGLFIIHSGRGAENTLSNSQIWSHAWKTHVQKIVDGVIVHRYSIEPEYLIDPGDSYCGVYAHEMGHSVFGLPDLYDTDYSSDGLGKWSLMADGGGSPVCPDAWSHFQMGYIIPTVITSNISNQTIHNVENFPEVYLLSNNLCGGEYFLVENRQNIGYDSGLPGNGLLIYHIDESVNNNNNEWYPGHTSSGHFRVALEQSDGLWELERKRSPGGSSDPYPGWFNRTNFNSSTIPDSKTYNFDYTAIEINNISSSSSTMTADFKVEFQIPLLIIMYPSGGDVITIGSNTIITYASIGNSGYVNLDYSTDGGSIWNNIATNVIDDGDWEDWIVPNTPSTNCKIRVSDADGYPSVISSDLFTIIPEGFSEQSSIVLTGVTQGAATWGDYDNDGDLDILLSGDAENGCISKIYQNIGNDFFTEQSIPLEGVYQCSQSWGDYDNDGYLDILLSGYLSGGNVSISKIYRNNGNNTFTKQDSISLTGVNACSVSWGDYNNDGGLDILLSGRTEDLRVSKIYRNNSDNTFTEQSSISLIGVGLGSSAWGDYDNDGFLDILLTGLDNDGRCISKIYHNEGGSSLIEQNSILLIGVRSSSSAWGDYDNDGFLDILLTGIDNDGNYISKIYHNEGGSSLIDQNSISLIGVRSGSVAWGDSDNDGLLDIIITGWDKDANYISQIYRNNGDNTFEQTSIYLTGVIGSTATWGDYDTDGDLDVLITGVAESGNRVSKIYQNTTTTENTLPTIPANLKTTVNGNALIFNWDKSTDNETQQNGLTYNLLIGTSPGVSDILSPMSDINTGKRKIVSMGNAGHCNSWTIKGLPDGQYYWSVQSIDNCFAGSAFAETRSFTIPATESITISYPVGGEILEVNSNTTITYISTGNSGLVNLDYSTDEGVTWDTIATNQLDDGDYEWIVPNTPSTNCKIRVTDIDGYPSSICDSTFTIKDIIPVELIHFSVTVNGSKIFIEWKTSTETNNEGFVIERKYEKSDWIEIGFVKGSGTSTIENAYNFIDNTVYLSGSYSYRLKQIDYNGSFKYLERAFIKADLIPEEYSLSQNYPNPFNPNTKVKYTIPHIISTEERNLFVELKVYDVLGNEVATLVDEYKPAGNYEVEFDAVGMRYASSTTYMLASGIYYYQLKAGSFVQTKKMVLLR